MKLQVVLPSSVFLEQEVTKVVAEAYDGSFCILPRHVDMVAGLPPGLVAILLEDGTELFLGIDEGVLVKRGPSVRISTWNAVQAPLGELRSAVLEQLRARGEREIRARSALDRLEASLVRQILEWQGSGHGSPTRP